MNAANDQLLRMYEKMVTIRRFEERTEVFFKEGIVRGSFHPSIGEEGILVGAISALRDDDYVISYHRGHGAGIAKGVPPKYIMAELFGKKTGCCQGLGGSMHICDPSMGFLGANGIVGGGLPHAVGAALASKTLRDGKVTVCFFGEGASNQGTFHEALNLASLWKLPVIYICQNNKIAVTTLYENVSLTSVARKGSVYGMRAETVDGFDVLASHKIAIEAVRTARDGQGSVLIESITGRLTSHSMGVREVRDPEEVAALRATRDPIQKFKEYLLKSGTFTEDVLRQAESRAISTVEEAVKFAEESPEPDISEIRQHVVGID